MDFFPSLKPILLKGRHNALFISVHLTREQVLRKCAAEGAALPCLVCRILQAPNN